ncbi:MAG: hypothetical protein HYV07_04315 [Deltaproteobacteria bacterium]|nr:hypothetical protein [Deltaproteobacteria bacterium]
MPIDPTAQTSVALLPHTPLSAVVVPLSSLDQTLPSQRRMMPSPPTAKTLLGELPHTLESQVVVLLWTLDQVMPS